MPEIQTVQTNHDRNGGEFYRFLPFIATNGRRNPASERSKVAIAQVIPTYLTSLQADLRISNVLSDEGARCKADPCGIAGMWNS